MDIFENYQDGVIKAEQDGHIQHHFPTHNGHSHTHGIDYFNSRVLDEVTERILRVWKSPKPPRILEIGPGAGAAASAMSILLPDAIIHTAGGETPINPYWRFSNDILFEESGTRNVAATVKRKLRELRDFSKIQKKLNYTCDDLMRIQYELGLKIFDVLQSPYIHYQWVNKFPDDCKLEEGFYDFVYESNGPNYHLRDSNIRAITYSCLSPKGILSMNSTSPLQGREEEVEAPFVIPMRDHIFTINPGNFLANEFYESPYSLGVFTPVVMDQLLKDLQNN